jgi:hypothetical protein
MYNDFVLQFEIKNRITKEYLGKIQLHDLTPEEADVVESALKRNGCTTVKRIEKVA